MTWRLEVSLPKSSRYVTEADRNYARSMERETFEYREQAAHTASVVRDFLIHRRATVRVIEVTL